MTDFLRTNIATVVDVETTFQITEEGKFDPSPYNEANALVSIGLLKSKYTEGWGIDCTKDYLCFYHNHEEPTKNRLEITQERLDETEILIGHNLKFDLSWLRELGFIYNGPVLDTMIFEYVLSGTKLPFSLDACCERYGIEGKDKEIEKYLEQGIGFEEIPWPKVKEYGLRDISITCSLLNQQLKRIGVELRDVLQSYDDPFWREMSRARQIRFANPQVDERDVAGSSRY